MGRVGVIPSCRHPKGIAPATPPGRGGRDAAPLPPLPAAVGKPEASAIRNLKNAGFKIKKTAQTRTSGQYGVVLSQSWPGGTRARPKPVVRIVISNVQRSPKPGTGGRILEGAPKVSSGCGAIATISVLAGNVGSSESDVVDDHVRLRQHQTVAVGLALAPHRARHIGHAATTRRDQTVGGSSCGSELRAGGRSTEMISDRCSYAYRKFWSSAAASSCCQRPKRGDFGGRAFR